MRVGLGIEYAEGGDWVCVESIGGSEQAQGCRKAGVQ
jgi:hypothetical protein